MFISQQIAAHAVAHVISGHNLTEALSYAQKRFPKATPQQLAGGTDLSYGTLRYLNELEAYQQALIKKPIQETWLSALILVGLYQLKYDSARSFTVVDQAVKAVTFGGLTWAKGLVNAVLRNFIRQREGLEKKVLKNEAYRYAYPQWWIEKLKQQYPSHWENILQTGQQHPPMTLRVNLRKIAPEAYLDRLTEQQIEAERLGLQAIMLKTPCSVEALPGFREGMVSVQDYGAQLVPLLLDVRDGMRVLDACSAPGGKTCHLLESFNIEMQAFDVDAERLKKVRENLQRLGLNAELQQGDAASGDWNHEKPFNRILADVPCSASGIVRRHVDMKWLRRKEDIAFFAQQQAVILSNLWQFLAKDGKLLYVTCSVFREENQEQIDKFLASHADAKQLSVSELMQSVPGLHIEQGQLIPELRHDGLFYALLQKK